MAALAAFLTRKPPLVQALVVGICAGLFVTTAAEANERDPRINSMAVAIVPLVLLAPTAMQGLRATAGARRAE